MSTGNIAVEGTARLAPVVDPRADALRERYHALFGGSGVPVPVQSIAEDLLGLSIAEDPELDCSGVLLPAQRQIVLNGREARESPGRRRFTLAHELGHWVCQVLEGEAAPVYCRSEEIGVRRRRNPIEREANVFAAELLMPKGPVRAEFGRSGRPANVARCFAVSGDAMAWRLYNLGLVDGSPV